MRTLARRARHRLRLPEHDGVGKSWADRFTPEQYLRANSALGSIEIDVAMGKKDDAAIVSTGKLLLRGVNRMSWSD